MLELKKICKEYLSGADGVRALRGVDINFRKNEFVSILGPSGCGKTTLLNIIGGLDRYSSGDLVINGRSTKDYRDGDWDVYRNRSIGFVFQSYNLIPHQSVLANVELALTLSGVSKAERRRRATEALEKVGLGDQLKKRPSQMSGGQMQRVAIARALVNNPDILLADEPTGALDTVTSEQVMELLHEVAKDRLVIMVTHNPDLAERYSTRIISLRDGLIVNDTMPYDPTAEEKVVHTEEVSAPKAKTKEKKIKKKPMSILTASSLSKNNLMTKKARTFLTSFAGSIGIIGIALILALSTGINNYIDMVQKDTLSSYPIQLMAEELDMSAILSSLMESEEKKANREDGRVYSNTVMYELISAYIGSDTKKNNLSEFKKYIESSDEFKKYASAVQYGYNTPLNIFAETQFGLRQVEPSNILESVMPDSFNDSMSSMGGMSGMMSGVSGLAVWSEILPAKDGGDINSMLYDQYDLVYGDWPKSKEDVVLILNANNEVSDMSLYALGLKDSAEVEKMMKDILAGRVDESYTDVSYSYDEIMSLKFKLLLPDDYYVYDSVTQTYKDMRENETFMGLVMKDEDTGVDLRVCGIIKPNPDAVSTALSGTVGYTKALTDYVIEKTNDAAVVKAQRENTKYDVINGLEFDTGENREFTDAEKKQRFIEYTSKLTEKQRAELLITIMSTPTDQMIAMSLESIKNMCPDIESKRKFIIDAYMQSGEAGIDAETLGAMIAKMDEAQLDDALAAIAAEAAKMQLEQMVGAQLAGKTDAEKSLMLTSMLAGEDSVVAGYHDAHMPSEYSEYTHAERMTMLGEVNFESPSSINIYADTFEDKEMLSTLIAKYNEGVAEEDRISYTDIVALAMSGISTIINVISYVLIAFVSISLVVSSIMIGIITYISVLERTKEIGILRAIGASKGDISRVFNAETLIVGFVSGFIGIVMTMLICIPANAIIQNLTGIASLEAVLEPIPAVVLVLISMLLTFFAGLVPSKIAAKKDPVVALRSE